VFRIDLELLDKGLSKLDAIITLLFEYVSLIEAQGISQWRHDEMRQLAEIKLRFLDSVEPLDYVAQVSASDRDKKTIEKKKKLSGYTSSTPWSRWTTWRWYQL
jgi:secreted Zn-dependent insulinase-like peptidase